MAAVGAVHSHPGEVRLWEGGAPGSEKFAGVAEVVEWRTEKDSITGESFSFPTVTNIHVPTITPYLPKGVGHGRKGEKGVPAVIIAPGGGHQFLTINHEGYDVAEYLARHGVAAFVLKYRLARARSYPAGTYAIEREALADGQRAIRLVRARAGEWGIDPEKIGMMVFSAGGEVAVQVNLHSTEGRTEGDAVDRESCRMNFEGLIYPGVSRLIQPVKEGAGGGGGWPPVFLAPAGVSGVFV
jgi:endo-1,4-beta-xylanase